jgi:hypothetical protein
MEKGQELGQCNFWKLRKALADTQKAKRNLSPMAARN